MRTLFQNTNAHFSHGQTESPSLLTDTRNTPQNARQVFSEPGDDENQENTTVSRLARPGDVAGPLRSRTT